jgi:predicted branched-subunit amino acid permease
VQALGQNGHSANPTKRLRRVAFKEGVNTVLVTVPGNFAWGFVVGLGMINLGLSVFQSSAFNLLVYSGSAQMVAMPLMAVKASLTLVFFASFMASIRFVLYSAAMAPALHHLPLKLRLFVSAFSIDAAIGLFLARRSLSTSGQQSFPHRISFLMGMNTLIWSAWTSGVFAGIFAAGLLPSSPKFSYLGIVALFGIAIGMIRTRAAIACAVASAVVAVLAGSWPYQLGLLTAIIVGIATGFAALARDENN